MTQVTKIKSRFSEPYLRDIQRVRHTTLFALNWSEARWNYFFSYNHGQIIKSPSDLDPLYPTTINDSFEILRSVRTDLLYLDYSRYVNEPGWHQRTKVPMVEYSPRKIDLVKYLALPPKPVFVKKSFKGVAPKLDLKLKPPVFSPPKGSSPRRIQRWYRLVLPHLESERAKFESRITRVRALKHKRKLAKFNLRKRNFEAAQANRLEAFRLKLAKWERRKKLVAARRHKISLWKSRQPLKRRKISKDRNLVDHPFLHVTLVPEAGALNDIAVSWDSARFAFDGVNPNTREGQQVSWQTNWGDLDISDPAYFPDKNKTLSQIAINTVNSVKPLLDVEINFLDSKTLRKIYGKIANRKVHIGNFLAERAQTFDLLATSLRRLAEFVGAKKHLFKLVGNYVKSPKRIANDFLAFKFGIEPLVSDIDGALKTLLGTSDSLSIVARSKTKIPVNKTTDTCVISGYLSVSYVLRYGIENDVLHSLNSLGLVNPAEILWEVTPWSFVVDWFVPVGSYIESLNADKGLVFTSGTRTVKFIGTINPIPGRKSNGLQPKWLGDVAWCSHLASVQPDTFVAGAPAGKLSLQFTERTVLLEPPDRFMFFMKNPVSVTHGLLSLSLLIQKIFKK